MVKTYKGSTILKKAQKNEKITPTQSAQAVKNEIKRKYGEVYKNKYYYHVGYGKWNMKNPIKNTSKQKSMKKSKEKSYRDQMGF